MGIAGEDRGSDNGGSITVDFVQRRRIDNQHEDSSGAEQVAPADPQGLEGIRLIDRVTAGAGNAPPAAPERPEADEFFDDLSATEPATTVAQPEESDQVDPWIQEQARPAPAASIATQPQPNGTAHLPADVPTHHPARERKPRQTTLDRDFTRARARAIRLGAATLAGAGVLVAGAIALTGGTNPSTRTHHTPSAAIATPPALTTALRSPSAAQTNRPSPRSHHSRLATHKQRARRAVQHAHHTVAAATSHPTAVVAQTSSSAPVVANQAAVSYTPSAERQTSSSTPTASSQPAVSYTPAAASSSSPPSTSKSDTSGSSGSSRTSSGSSGTSSNSTAPAGPTGSSALLGPGHCSC